MRAPGGETRPTWAQPLLLLLVGAGLVLAGWLVGEAIAGPLDGTVGEIDRDVVEAVEDAREPWLDWLMRKATFFGSTIWMVAALTIAVLVAAFWVRSPRWMAFLVGCMIGAYVSTLVKNLVDRPRPESGALVDISSPAFPSGHALTAAITFGALAVFVIVVWGVPRNLTWAAAAGAALVVGFTRVYLGVHWPTDVIAGWLLGACWVWAVGRVVQVRSGTAQRGRAHPTMTGGPRSAP